jgi:hypothetical protein
MRRHGPWRVLGIDPTEDRSAIRRAYAEKLKGLDPDSDIEGFTALRNARDHALTLAKSLQAAEAGDEGEQEPFEPDAPAFADAYVASEEDVPAEPIADETGEPTPPTVLVGILFPQGEYSDQPLTADERAWATQALAAVLDEANRTSIDQQRAIEGWVAHHLASAWPRSAFLLEPAVEAFGWLDEFGQLSERPAVQFLNERHKGMRFVHQVEQPEHRLHKAWTELSQPGPRRRFALRRTNRDDVIRLLNGIRERYPEVERHLDPLRVASWDKAATDTPSSPWKTAWPILFVVVLVLQVLSFAGRDSTQDPLPRASAFEREERWTKEETDGLVIELFGERLDDDKLKFDAPDLWRTIQSRRGADGKHAEAAADAAGPLLQQARLLTLLAAREASFEQLVAIKQVKLDLLRIALESSGASGCTTFNVDGTFPDGAPVPEDLRARERALAARLVDAGLFRRSQSEFPTQAAIPGPVVERILSRTGMSEAAFDEAAQGEGSDSSQCQYRIALLEAVLRQPGKVSEDLLRMI